MAKIKVEITATPAQFSTFADELGYQTEVLKSPEELALLVEPITIQDRIKPNPENKTQFLERMMKDIVVNELYRKKAQVVDVQVNDAKEAEKAALRTAIAGAVGVTSVV